MPAVTVYREGKTMGMKKCIVIGAAVVLLAAFAANPAHATASRLNKVVNEMQNMVFQPMKKWQMSDNITKEEALEPNTTRKFKSVGIGYFWAVPKAIWLRTAYTVPEKILNMPVAGTRISLTANIEEYGEIYINGELKQAFHRSEGRIVLTESAKPGEKFFIVIMAQRKDNDTGLLRKISLDYDILRDVTLKITSFVESFNPLNSLIRYSGEDPEKWTPVLDAGADQIDLKALEEGRMSDFYASLDRCVQALLPLSAIVKQYSMLLVGYSHIDLSWLWTREEAENIVVKGTSEEVLGLQKEFPDWVYVMNQMHAFRWMEKDYPELFARMRQAILDGRWEPVGAEWVEPDGNLPHGESYVRQFMYGRKYSLEKFGKVSTIGWTPDSFGYNWNLPQILAKSDMRGFVTQKISWNETTHFPYHLFWWESPDGSRVLVYFPEGGYGESVDGNTMASQLINMNQNNGEKTNLVIFGIGDHGGGIPRDYVERAFALRESPIYPKIEFPTVEKVFDRALEDDKTLHFPLWDTELYLEHHRGTYTTQAKTKNNNRRNELRLLNSERFSSIASISGGIDYPFAKIEEAWKTLLFNQFHDILPGSSITPVYKDADKDHAWIEKQTKEATAPALKYIAKNAMTSGKGTPIVLFNGLSWTRDDIIEIDLDAGVKQLKIINDVGEETPVQIIDKGQGKRVALFVARSVPPLGYAVYHEITGAAPKAASRPLSVSGNTIENEFFKVTIDPTTGWASSIYDKKNKKNIIENGKSAFQLQAYKEDTSSDAWDPRFKADGSGITPPPSSLMNMPDAEEVKIVENGPVRITIMSRRKFGVKSEFRQYISLVEGMPIVYGRLEANWHETDVFLKSAFNLNLKSDYAAFEIPYANIKRSTKYDTPARSAQWEVSGHRWADYTDASQNFGVTLLSFSKYGYDVKDNVLRMTMLRCPTGPDPLADRGFHSIPYAIYTHAGDWPDGDVPLRGQEYNDPVIVLKTDSHTGTLGTRHSFFAARPDNVVISTIKKAENGEGFIIRIVETEGRDGTATITLPSAPKKVSETNLVERELGAIPTPEGNTLTVPIKHYEIKTIRVVF
jgi:alpha-mannosidase